MSNAFYGHAELICQQMNEFVFITTENNTYLEGDLLRILGFSHWLSDLRKHEKTLTWLH